MKKLPVEAEKVARLVDEWRLFDRRKKMYHGQTFFYERWVHDRSKSGVVFYSTLDKDGRVFYVVEGYGIGTINSKTFTERSQCAPIQRSEHYSLEEATEALQKLKRENLKLWRKRSGILMRGGVNGFERKCSANPR